MNRRDLMISLPLLGASTLLPAQAAEDPDAPLLAAYEEWKAARAAWKQVYEECEDEHGDTPVFRAAEDRWDVAFLEVMKHEPVGMAGIAALAAVWWDEYGPAGVEGSELLEIERGLPSNAFVLRIWRAASGQDGYPTLLG